VKESVRFHEPMSRHTTFRIGGPADRFVVPSSVEELQALIRERGDLETFTVVGAGSNLLVLDGGIRGTVVYTGRLDWIEVEGNKASVGTGVMLPGLLRKLSKRGLGGLEFLAGIPGTVGGAVVMNAGTREGTMTDCLLSATLMLPTGRIEKIERRQMKIGYRTVDLPQNAWVIGAELQMEPKAPETIEKEILQRIEERKTGQPLGVPSAGSVFKNPSGDYAGRLIEEAGMKGARIGDAQVSTVHANYIVNRGTARAADVVALIQKIQEKVSATFGIGLELELKIVGEPHVMGEPSGGKGVKEKS
jgi:UDP-N-acetylmuramate dehydrogenase